MKFRLSIVKGGTVLRTPTIVGEAEMPRVGKRFEMWAPPLEGGCVRLLSTSPVQGVAEDNGIVFRTLNSTYRLTPLAN